MSKIKVNENGIKQIAKTLREFHHRAGFLDATAIYSWAAVVEENFAQGKGATYQISSYESITGHAEDFALSSDGYDAVEGGAV